MQTGIAFCFEKNIQINNRASKTESSEAHSFLFNYRNYLCNKLRLIFVLWRTFKIKVTECTRKRYIIFLRIGKKSFSGNGNILFQSRNKFLRNFSKTSCIAHQCTVYYDYNIYSVQCQYAKKKSAVKTLNK